MWGRRDCGGAWCPDKPQQSGRCATRSQWLVLPRLSQRTADKCRRRNTGRRGCGSPWEDQGVWAPAAFRLGVNLGDLEVRKRKERCRRADDSAPVFCVPGHLAYPLRRPRGLQRPPLARTPVTSLVGAGRTSLGKPSAVQAQVAVSPSTCGSFSSSNNVTLFLRDFCLCTLLSQKAGGGNIPAFQRFAYTPPPFLPHSPYPTHNWLDLCTAGSC